jgi:uncharacterized protein (DUF2147 family)
MKSLVTLTLVATMAFNLSAQTNLTGVWKTGEENTKIKLYKHKSGFIYGKILSSDNSKAKIGKVIIKNVKYENGKWTGKLYSPKRNTWYKAQFTPSKSKLKIKLFVGWTTKTIQWKK